MWAAGGGHSKTIRALVATGADLTLRDNRGKTALQIANETGHAEAAQALAEGGAKE